MQHGWFQGGAFDEDFLVHARKVFDSYDSRGFGHLDRQEAKLAWVALLGSRPSRCDLADLLRAVPGGRSAEMGNVGVSHEDGVESMDDARVGWAQFAQAASRRRIGTDCSDEIRQAFKAFDRRCAGFLTLADVKAVQWNVSVCLFQEARLWSLSVIY